MQADRTGRGRGDSFAADRNRPAVEPDEYARRPHWGHSTPDHAIYMAAQANAKNLILFHHDPHRTDQKVDAIEGVYRARAMEHGLMLVAAREGLTLQRESKR